MISNYLAEILGISIAIISLSLLIREKNIKIVFNAILNDTGLFISGAISLVVGIAIILAHNLWVKDWRVIITIIGWMALLKGLVRLFMPEKCEAMLKKCENSPFLPYGLVVAVFIGLILTYFGFTA